MLYVAASMSLGKTRLVLHRPQSAENVGAAARVMKNFGLARLAIVAPPAWEGAPRGGGEGTAREDVFDRAGRLARHAADVLAGAEVHADLPAALAEVTWTCGTSSRAVEGRPRLTPRELAAEVVRRAAHGEVAVVFGEERRGLSDEELELCQAVCTIPTSPAYDSMNLAQAVAVVAYELALAAGAGLPAPPPGPEPARHATLEALWARLGALLEGAGYLNPQNPAQILAEWRRLLARAEPTQREVELLLAAVKALQRKVRLDGGAR
jgi:tRNA/rRNA methyltransferase